MNRYWLLILLILAFPINDVMAYEIGTIEFTEWYYLLDDSPKVKVTDNDLNVNSTIFETITINIRSGIDAGGTDLILNETGIDTGIFEGNFTLTTTQESKDSRLRVDENDTITAEYEDNTLPPPYYLDDERDITTTSFVSGVEPIIITMITDKPSYFEGEVILITGEVSEILDDTITLIIKNQNNNLVAIQQLSINSDKKFSGSLVVGGLISGNKSYTITAQYENEINSISITFDVLKSPITIQTDNTQYYQTENIFINGTMIDINWNNSTAITYDVYHDSQLINSGDGGILNNNGTFNFTIDALQLNNDGEIQVAVNIQNYSSSIFFDYYNIPNKTSDANYDRLMIHGTILNDHDNSMNYHNQTQSQLLDRVLFLEETVIEILAILNAPPIPSDAPEIILLTADDPDDLDTVYSIDDTITILFDSCTNQPGGNGPQTRVEVNDLFTFSESLGQAYNGKWESCDSFVITIKGINNAGVTIGTTTVTPAGTVPIYPADNTPDPSIVTSPILDGNWGE